MTKTLASLKITLLFFFLVAFNGSVSAQSSDYSVLDGVGPGQKHLFSESFALGFYVPVVEKNNPINIWGSNEFWTGLKYRNRFHKSMALGGELNVQVGSYKIDQDADNKVFKDTNRWKRERLSNISFELAPFVRFYLMKKMHEGLYLDLVLNNELMITRFHTIIDPNASSGSKRSTNQRLKYMNFYRVSAQARIGWKNLQFYGKYRLTNIFRTHNNNLYPELPRFSFGIIYDFTVK